MVGSYAQIEIYLHIDKQIYFSYFSFNFSCYWVFTSYLAILKIYTSPYLGASYFAHPPFFQKKYALDTTLISEHHLGIKVISFYPSINNSIYFRSNI